MRCLICGTELNGCLCPRCGFDLSRCREQYPTLADDSTMPEAVWAVRAKRFEAFSVRQAPESLPAPVPQSAGRLAQTPAPEERPVHPISIPRTSRKVSIFFCAVICGLAALLILGGILLFPQRDREAGDTGAPLSPTQALPGTTQAAAQSTERAAAQSTEPIGPSGTEQEASPDLSPIDREGLKAALDESLSGLTSEWQVMVIDPWDDTTVSSSVNCKAEDWMTANRMTQVFIMGAVFQQAADGSMSLDEVMEDVKAMLGGDSAAADRLTEKLGGGDAAKGRETVKAFAWENGLKLGFNRPNSGTANKKNYATVQQTAELLNRICRGELVSGEASAQMLELLLSCANSEDIDVGLTGDGIRYGFIHDVEDGVCVNTMGVVQLKNRSFVISAISYKPITTDGAKEKITELISKTVSFFSDAE